MLLEPIYCEIYLWMHMKYPDQITCFDPTCMQDRVWGEVCISWSSTVVVIVSDSYVHDLL